jgi:hypothetical protein
MRADRSALATNKPIKQIQNGLWDPEDQPFGVGAVITVRDMNEVAEFQITDVPASVIQSEAMLHQAKERVGGLADSAVGVLSDERRTLGENQARRRRVRGARQGSDRASAPGDGRGPVPDAQDLGRDAARRSAWHAGTAGRHRGAPATAASRASTARSPPT